MLPYFQGLMSKSFPFNVRVYGILVSDDNEVLLTDEIRNATKMTKFPGGGLRFGEGTVDCLKREWLEECRQKIEVLSHFYTTESFHASAFDDEQQVISIYYLVEAKSDLDINTKKIPFDFDQEQEGAQIFRWATIDKLTKEDVTYPIDKVVVGRLKEL